MAAGFLSRAFLVSDEETALRLARQHDGTRLLFVTRGGFAVQAGASLLSIGGSSKATGLICRAGEIESCQEDLREAERALREARKKKEELEKVRTRSLESLEEMRQKVRTLQQACFDKETEVSTARAQLEACNEELGVLHERVSSAKTASEEATQAIQRTESRLREAESTKERCEEDLRQAEARERDLEAERTAAQREFHEAHTLWAEAERALREIEAESARLSASAEELSSRRVAKEREAKEARESAVALEEEVVRLDEELAQTGKAKLKLEESLSETKEEFEKSEAVLAGKEHEAREARSKAQDATKSVHDIEIRLTQVSTEAGGLKQRVSGEHEVDLNSWAPPEETDQSLEEMELELEELRTKVSGLGAVNLLAVDDYKRCRDRREFLTTQRNDLVQARESLLEAIEKINITASSLFMETFEKVRENFRKTFSTLFKGGEAEISLIGDDPLEAEVDIQARPGGKKFQSLKLLSGGETALTAISLLFAVYLVKPSPFCILDEVDAPLDDVNVEKFVSMIHEFSSRTQFIVVTHNKATMEAADRLYGITMAEPGTSKLVSVRFDELGKVSQPETEAVAAAV
jgi:chromosome segregation protein